MNRRGFLSGIAAALAAVAVTTRLARASLPDLSDLEGDVITGRTVTLRWKNFEDGYAADDLERRLPSYFDAIDSSDLPTQIELMQSAPVPIIAAGRDNFGCPPGHYLAFRE
jgi:hypothetical protein